MASLQPWSVSPVGAYSVTVVLRRLDTFKRMVRYERTIEYDVNAPCNLYVEYGPAFEATLQEWERAIP